VQSRPGLLDDARGVQVIDLLGPDLQTGQPHQLHGLRVGVDEHGRQLTSVLFAALHYSPATQQDNAWLIVLWAGAFGVVAADLTARSGTLGPAIALHLVNNTLAIALMAPKGNFDGLALYSYPFSLQDSTVLMQWMPVEMMVLFCTWLVARLALRR